jgi:type II secretory pathway pseudopilin PulG
MMAARSARGFTLVETLVAGAIVLALAGAMIELARGARAAAAVVAEMADVQQRMRVAAEAIQHDLAIAGAGADAPRAGPLVRYLPPIRPYAGLAGESDITYGSDRISILTVPDVHAEAEVTGPMGGAGELPVGRSAACALSPDCGFRQDMQAIVFDTGGPGFGYDIFLVGDASAGWLTRKSGEASFSRAYAATAHVSEVEQHAYFLDRSDAASVRLMRGNGRSAFPLVDGVRDLRFTYYADPDPASVSAAGAEAGTCVYAAGPPPRPLLSVLGGASLSELTASNLTDGPFCGVAPNRFDADLLRIRRVRVTLVVDSPAVAPPRRTPLLELSFDVSPRNLNVSR